MSKIWPWRVFKLNISTVFSFDVGVLSEKRKNKDKMKTPHTFLTWTTSKRHILTEITIQCCVSYLCLQPSHHLRGTASVHQDIPVPAGPAPPQASGLDVHGSTGTTANPSGNQTFWTLLFALWLNPTKGWKKRMILLFGPTKSDQPRQRCQLKTKEQNSSYVNINAGLVRLTPEPEVW